MSEWQQLKLGDIVTLNYGKALKTQDRKDGAIPVFSSAGHTGLHNEALVESKGIIVGRKGTVGKIYISDGPFWCIDTAYYILPNPTKYDFTFLFYLLKTLGLEELNEDSAVPGLNRDTAYSQYIVIPQITEQKAIASVLSSLDDKIDLLHRQNKTLESMAETLFRQWFVEEAQDDWNEIFLGKLFTISSGKGLKRNQFDEYSSIPVLGANGQIGLTDKALFEEKLIYTGRVGTLGQVFIVDSQPVWLSDNTLVFRNIEYFYFTYFHLKAINFQEYNVGSTQPLIRQSDIKEVVIYFPSNENMLIEFETQAKELFFKIARNQKQIQTLEKLRDTLLPKLMSGEVRVQYTKE